MDTPREPVFSLVVPTYNERENLPLLVERVTRTLDTLGVAFEIIVVDDDSPDGTWKLAAELASKDPRVKVIRRQGQRGLATAVAAGWSHARGLILGVTDGDLQYPPEALPELLRPLLERRADIAVASRYDRGATIERWSPLRKAISLAARALARRALPGSLGTLRDPGSGYFVFRRSVIEHVELRPVGFKILIEVLARGRYDRVVEIPHPYEGRQRGASKLTRRQILEYLSHLARLAWDTGDWVRFRRWGVVGCFGVLVNVGLLWMLTELYGLYYVTSALIAVECAIINNFLWNDGWTFADRTRGRRRVRHRWQRFWKFNAICAGGAVLNVGVLWLLTDLLGLHYLVSAIGGIGAAVVWNYGLNPNRTWLIVPTDGERAAPSAESRRSRVLPT